MRSQTIRLTQKDFPIFGKAFSLVNISFLVINENMELEYINDTAKKNLKLIGAQPIENLFSNYGN